MITVGPSDNVGLCVCVCVYVCMYVCMYVYVQVYNTFRLDVIAKKKIPLFPCRELIPVVQPVA
jgi:hypothetical protein